MLEQSYSSPCDMKQVDTEGATDERWTDRWLDGQTDRYAVEQIDNREVISMCLSGYVSGTTKTRMANSRNSLL